MSSFRLKAILVVSLCFNAAVAGTIVAHLAMRPDIPPRKGPGALPPEELCRLRSHRLAAGIGLSDSKAVHLEREMVRCCPQEEGIRERIERERSELFMLFREADPDTVAVMARVESIASLQEKLEKSMVRKILRSHALLDPGERERLFKMIGCDPAHRCAPLGRPGGRARQAGAAHRERNEDEKE